ncbi:MAG TPA: translation initiation factor IF-3 [Planctomycetota bacterium]|nr:translation initiation factor IF-3 [Planctomycetota bacterium]
MARNRVNLQIRVPEVRVIGADNEQLGVMSTDQARGLARERLLDLVEISPTAVPPVCKIMDFGKFKYEQKKKENESRKKQHQMQLKELRLRTRTGDHDVDVKLKKAREFLLEGDKVSFYVMFRGREVVHPEIGHGLLGRCVTELADIAKVERPARLEGKRMTMVLTPTKTHGAGGASKPPAAPRPASSEARPANAPAPAPGPATE